MDRVIAQVMTTPLAFNVQWLRLAVSKWLWKSQKDKKWDMKLLTENTKANPKALESAGIRGMVYDVRHLQVSHRVPRGGARVEGESKEENSENEKSYSKAKEENAPIDRDRVGQGYRLFHHFFFLFN